MLSETEREAMRTRHARGDAQLREILGYVRGFAENDADVRFTPAILGTITADTLVVFGDRDFLYPVSIAFELHSAIPRSHLWVVPNGGHGPIFGALAPQFVQTATAFLRGDWR
jgi:pimeloyl-ACP methyl ester carboxylesterase